MKVLTWNIGEWEVDEVLLTVTNESLPDLLFFTEVQQNGEIKAKNQGTPTRKEVLKKELRDLGYSVYDTNPIVCIYVHNRVVANISSSGKLPETRLNKVTYLHINELDGRECNLYFFGLHLVSKVSNNDIDQYAQAQQIALDLFSFIGSKTKTATNTPEIVILGDFNMNPWEYGLTHSRAFNSTYIFKKEPTLQPKLTIHNGESFKFFNPTWVLYAQGINNTETRNGTFKSKNPSPSEFDWTYIDQVLINKELLSIFDYDSLRVGNNVEKPKEKGHYPLIFVLKFLTLASV